jgi:cell division initiation protein
MLSPEELENKRVASKRKKYDKIQMDEYLDLVLSNYKELYADNQELQKNLKKLSDGIQYYRSIESTMQKALVLAEKTSKETKDAAILKAEAIEKDANKKAENIITEAEQEYDRIREKCIALVQQFNQYKTQLKQVATTQLELVTSESFDVNSPNLESFEPEHFHHSEEGAAKESHTEEKNTVENAETVSAPTTNTVSEVSEDTLGETTVIPDVKPTVTETAEPTDEETLSILTADTIDLSDSIQQVQDKESQAETKITEPVQAEPKQVQNAAVLEPIDAEYQSVTPKDMGVLEPAKEESAEAPTLDALLQSMNMGGKNKKKKGQDDDPFEFLGSVDDF